MFTVEGVQHFRTADKRLQQLLIHRELDRIFLSILSQVKPGFSDAVIRLSQASQRIFGVPGVIVSRKYVLDVTELENYNYIIISKTLTQRAAQPQNPDRYYPQYLDAFRKTRF